jgi:hypothetical protein
MIDAALTNSQIKAVTAFGIRFGTIHRKVSTSQNPGLENRPKCADSGATDLPVFPDISPSMVKKSASYVIEENDIADENALHELLSLLFDFPERAFYYLHEKGRPLGAWIARARDCHEILLNETEFFYYRHPKFQCDYVRIVPQDAYPFQWEREAVEKGPMFLRTKLELTPRMRRQMEIEHKIIMEQKMEQGMRKTNPEHPFLLRPSLWGLGIDLHKAWPWLKSKLRKLRP